MADETRGNRKVRIGKVVSNKMDKTIVVAIETKVKHGLYGKYTVESNRKLGKNTIGPFSKQCDSWFSHRTGNGL